MQIKDVMSTGVKTVGANETAGTAAALMAAENIGAVPVVEEDRLVGMLTDRDITTRLVAQQRDASTTPVSAIMSGELRYCYETDEADDVARNMAELHVVRLPVVGEGKKLVGIVTAGDLTTRAGENEANEAENQGNRLDEALDETFPASDPISPA